MQDNILDRLHDLDRRNQLSAADTLAIRTAMAAVNDDAVVTLGDAIDEYLREDEGRLRASTINERRKSLRDFLAWRGDCELSAVVRAEAGRYVADVLIPRRLAPATSKHILGDLSGFWHWACGRGIAKNNPFDRMARTIKTPARGVRKDEHTELRPWTTDELLKLLTETDPKSDLWSMSVLALFTGCRENELAEMQCADVHSTHLSIPEAKTTAGRRQVPIHPLIAGLVKHLCEQARKTSSDGYLVSGLKRGGYDKKRHHLFAKRFSYHKTKVLGLPPAVVFHGLRKNFVTALHNLGVTPDRIAQIVGHERGSLALDRYSGGVDITKLAREVKKVTFGSRVDSLVTERIVEMVEGETI
jgi:integrase